MLGKFSAFLRLQRRSTHEAVLSDGSILPLIRGEKVDSIPVVTSLLYILSKQQRIERGGGGEWGVISLFISVCEQLHGFIIQVMWMDECVEFHRVWSALQFFFCQPPPISAEGIEQATEPLVEYAFHLVVDTATTSSHSSSVV